MFKSDLTGKQFNDREKVPVCGINGGIMHLMERERGEPVHFVSREDMDRYRQRYIEQSVREERKRISSLERQVLEKMRKHELVSADVEASWGKDSTIGEKVADRVASFGGSWPFIIIFVSFIGVWIAINMTALFSRNFDPYPFILLNLMLSCLAALQAPVIMMSQKRSEEKDRHRAREDYKVNLKSEIEIRTLHEKIDHMIFTQQGRMFEIQDIQTDIMREILDRLKHLDSLAK